MVILCFVSNECLFEARIRGCRWDWLAVFKPISKVLLVSVEWLSKLRFVSKHYIIKKVLGYRVKFDGSSQVISWLLGVNTCLG